MKVGILSPTTWQFVEKMAALFPEGIEVAGPLSDDLHYWNDYRRKSGEWEELGLKVVLNLAPYRDLDFSKYDVLIQSVETFSYSKDWANHCHRIECPLLIKACWTRDPLAVMPADYIERVRDYPVLLEMPAHAPLWRSAGFNDVNVIFNPVGDWLFAREWTGKKAQVLFVLSGLGNWRSGGDCYGLEIWEKLRRAFPGRTYHHDGHECYRTSKEMAELYSESRVFVNLDRPYGQGERPLTLAFTEALSAGLPVVARDLQGLSYKDFIGANGICTNDFQEMCAFIDACLSNLDDARKCSSLSREIAHKSFSYEALRPQYMQVVRRAQQVFDENRQANRVMKACRKFWRSVRKESEALDVFERLRRLFESRCPERYEIETKIKSFYGNPDYWEEFRNWERTAESYSIRDKAFVESAMRIDGSSIINIGCFYPWAEIEWGHRAKEWTGLDINSIVLQRANEALSGYPDHRVIFTQGDVISPLYMGKRFDYVLDLSTFDQLDPRQYYTALCNYTRFSNSLVMAYDATHEPLAVFDFTRYGFNALINPETMADMLVQMGYKIIDHRPFSYHNRSYISAVL